MISEELVNKLEELRQKFGHPIKITSGFRCTARQARLRATLPKGHTAAGRSSHEDGNAADITCSPEHLDKLMWLCESEFNSVGKAATFVHVDMRRDKIRRWSYV